MLKLMPYFTAMRRRALAPAMLVAFLTMTCAVSGGCARYEYDIVDPPDLAQHVGKGPVTVAAEPLEYTLRTYDNRLVMFVENPTEDPIKLLGEDSVIVD